MTPADPDRIGLCAQCRHAIVVRSDRGGTFYRCGRAATDSAFPKYPRLPVRECRGYEGQTNEPRADMV